jgi:tetratricopeptide (TPR) repeat protein
VRSEAADVVLTMPFENVSRKAEYNWIGESFAVMMPTLLETPGMLAISPDERLLAYGRVGLRASDLLTRAAVIRVADSAQANLAIVGTYDIGVDPKGVTIAISARLIETREGRLAGNKVFNFSGPLADLQTMQGQLAWNILYERNPSLSYSRDQLVRRARHAPPRAYESYVKGIQTEDPKLRETLLRRAIKEYESGGDSPRFAQAIYSLGRFYFQRREYDKAINQFEELTKDDPRYLEGLFYLGLAEYYDKDLKKAIVAYEKLIGPLPLVEVWNNAGALYLAQGDLEKSLTLLRQAVANSPYDPLYRFNYGYALWRTQKYEEAIEHLRVATSVGEKDGEGFYLLARSLGFLGRADEARQADDEARRHLESYAKWAIAPEQIPLLIRFKTDFNRSDYYRLERKQQSAVSLPSAQAISRQQDLDRARRLAEAGQDEEALAELGRLIAADVTIAEAHLLRGRILQRRKESDGAINAYRAAIQWNQRLIGAHIGLAQLYLARGDRPAAIAHLNQAVGIDPQDRDALALKRQIETGR